MRSGTHHFHRMRVEGHENRGNTAHRSGFHRAADQLGVTAVHTVEHADGEHTPTPVRWHFLETSPSLHTPKPTQARSRTGIRRGGCSPDRHPLAAECVVPQAGSSGGLAAAGPDGRVCGGLACSGRVATPAGPMAGFAAASVVTQAACSGRAATPAVPMAGFAAASVVTQAASSGRAATPAVPMAGSAAASVVTQAASSGRVATPAKLDTCPENVMSPPGVSWQIPLRHNRLPMRVRPGARRMWPPHCRRSPRII
ncbi:Uncharacterised protein [Nocardia africana]|uniref:Uncharacterized protein n=1 Tax=Nocardia africana TaxID=134964 RepID=A0A378X0H6_9NOCA|nr:Uncharacterised protein [Nocardia africana]